MEANNGLSNGKGTVDDDNNIGKWSNDIIDTKAVFSAVEVQRELADFWEFPMENNLFGRPTVAKTEEENTPWWRIHISNYLYGLNLDSWKGFEKLR